MSASYEDVFSEIITLVRQHALNTDLEYEKSTRIEALGVDSIDLMEILFRLEESHGVAISPLGLQGKQTLGEVVDYALTKISG